MSESSLESPRSYALKADPVYIELTYETIDTESLLQRATLPQCGAVLLFLGTTRRWTESTGHQGETPKVEETEFLVYESYEAMAIKQLQLIASQAFQEWPIQAIAISHRLGRVDVSQASIAIVVSSPHRRAAFAAGEWLIDTIKQQVPIWKKEIQGNGSSHWQHPT